MSRCIIEKHDRWDGWRYHWRQRYRSLGPLASQYTGINAGRLVEIWNSFFWHCNEKSFLKHDVPQHRKDRNLSRKCTPSRIRRQNHNGKVVDRNGFVFLFHKLVLNVSLVDWCARIRLNVSIYLLEKESSTGSTLLSAWGDTSNQWNI